MGCAPSRPSQSFYQEYFVEHPQKKAQESTRKTRSQGKKIAIGELAKQPKMQAPPLKETNYISNINKKLEDRNKANTLTREQEIALADLRIYESEMKARKEEEAATDRVYAMNRALNGKENWVF